MADAVVEVVARGPDALAFEVVGEFRQVRQQVVAVALPEDFRQRAGPGKRVAGAGFGQMDSTKQSPPLGSSLKMPGMSFPNARPHSRR